MVSSAVVSIVCMCVAGGCAVQGSEPDDPPAGEPAMQDLATPQLLTYSQPITTDQFGNIHLTGVLDISDHKEVDVEILQIPPLVSNMTVQVGMGAIGVVSSFVGSFALVTATPTNSVIHTFNVTGPQLNVNLSGGPPNTAVNIVGWVFLH
jgi:hypothetical protein